MELKLQLCVFMLLTQVSLAIWQRVTVKKGQTLHLRCPLTNAHRTNVDWKNPKGYIMFFNRNRALKNKRYSINKLSDSQFTISISNVTFKDGGNYTCSHYDRHTTERKVEVTVLGQPKMEVTKHEGRFVIKCSANGNPYPPQISWQFNNGPEILAHAQVEHEDDKYVSTDMLYVRPVENRVTVKCLVRHPTLLSQPLMNFIKIGQRSKKFHPTVTTSSPMAQTQGSAEVVRPTTGRFRHGRTTVSLTTRGGPPSEDSITVSAASSTGIKTVTVPTKFPADTITSTESHQPHHSTSGWSSVSEATEEITPYNSTESNRTGINVPGMRTGSEGSSSLLVLLVTCLTLCLLVVVIFFGIKLRRAHMTWKRENEDSDPSEESSKSKSSQEEKNSHGQRRRGVLNMVFTQYTTEEPAVITSVINPGAMTATECVNKEQTFEPQTLSHVPAKSDIKETEL